MKQKLLLVITMTLVSLFLVNLLLAQPRSKRFRRYRPKAKQAAAVGIRVGNEFQNDLVFAGGHLWLPLGVFWKFVPGADYCYTKNDSSKWQFNGDFLFKPNPQGMFYFGGGVATQYLNAEDINEQWDFGGNLVVGLDFGKIRGPVMYPYFQARWTFIDKEKYFSVLGGINLILK
jgi:hypothetical protein